MPQVGMSEAAKLLVWARYAKGLGAPRIAAELEDLHHAGQLPDDAAPPSQRAIGRELTRLRKSGGLLGDVDEEATWPESFGGPDGLPWEAAASLVELTRVMGRPPPLAIARWYWKVRLALPMEHARRCAEWAWALTMTDGTPDVQKLVTTAIIAGTPITKLKLPGFRETLRLVLWWLSQAQHPASNPWRPRPPSIPPPRPAPRLFGEAAAAMQDDIAAGRTLHQQIQDVEKGLHDEQES